MYEEVYNSQLSVERKLLYCIACESNLRKGHGVCEIWRRNTFNFIVQQPCRRANSCAYILT